MWQGIYGHDAIVERFRAALAAGRLASTYLFVGPPGIGKRQFALKFTQALLCRSGARALEPCGECESCVLFAAGNHPDLIQIARPAGKSSIPLELLIGDKEHRMRAGLCHDIGLKPFLGGRRAAIVDDADHLNKEGANALLKTLEEPPPGAVLILIGTSAGLQLPTIRSRCQVVRFQPLSDEDLVEILVQNGIVPDRQAAAKLASLSQGSVERAAMLADPALAQLRQDVFAALVEPLVDSLRLTPMINAAVDQAGREAAERRVRLRQVLSFAMEFYRQLMLAASGNAPTADPALSAAVERRLSQSCDAEMAADCLERTLETLGYVDRNANQATNIACWLDAIERRTMAAC